MEKQHGMCSTRDPRGTEMEQKLLVATHNQGKLLEYGNLLQDLPLTLTYLDEIGIHEEVAETGNTFAANALLKAQEYASMTGMWTWADDSPLWAATERAMEGSTRASSSMQMQ